MQISYKPLSVVCRKIKEILQAFNKDYLDTLLSVFFILRKANVRRNL